MFLWCALALRANWTQFDTEKKLVSACLLCKQMSKRLADGDNLERAPNSHCANHTNDPLCGFVEDLKNDMKSNEKLLSKGICGIIGPCISKRPERLMGPVCGQCLSIAHLIMRANPDDRYPLFDRFCESVSSGVQSACDALNGLGEDLLKQLFSVAKSPNDLCVLGTLCIDEKKMERKMLKRQVASRHIRPPRRQKSNSHRDEL